MTAPLTSVRAEVVQVREVVDTTVTPVHGAPPTVTVAPVEKFVPAIVNDVPPETDPDDGETPNTVGAAT